MDVDLQMQARMYEKRIDELLLTIQKQERDLVYFEEEVKSIKKIAMEAAEYKQCY